MSIQRVPEVPFAQISNEALRDKRLSFKARGILAMVLSHAGQWQATRQWLEDQSDPDGRASIQSALNELTNLGYRSVSKEVIDGEIRTVVEWRHTPKMSISRPTENLTVRNPDRQKTRPSLEHHSSEHNKSEDNLLLRFDDFWQVYPNRKARGAAVRAWKTAVKKADPDVIIAAAEAYARDPKRDPEFTAHGSTWLNGERWLDEVEKPKASGPVTIMDHYADEPCEHGEPRGPRWCAFCRSEALTGTETP